MVLRVVEWSTGTVGRDAIAGIDAHPDLELIGVWVSDPAKVGRDAGRLAGLDRDLGVIATDDAEALLALKPDAIVHTAMTDDRLTEAIEDLKRFLQAGIDVVSSGPVILQFPYGVVPDDMIAPIAEASERAWSESYGSARLITSEPRLAKPSPRGRNRWLLTVIGWSG